MIYQKACSMSRGIGAHANLIAQDDRVAIYEYGGYNLNDARFQNEDHVYDGLITIRRECFQKPEISKCFDEGLITVENCSNCWMEEDEIDVMALHILFRLFRFYQERGELPKHISYNV